MLKKLWAAECVGGRGVGWDIAEVEGEGRCRGGENEIPHIMRSLQSEGDDR